MSSATIDLNVNVQVLRPETNGHSTNGKNGLLDAEKAATVLPNGQPILTIYTTKNLDQFTSHPLQRDYDQAQERALRKSLVEHGFLAHYPLLVSKNLTIIDGHHRWKVACALQAEGVEIQVAYVIVPDLTMLQVRDTPPAKRWSVGEAEALYIKEGRADYVRFQAFRKEFDLSVRFALGVLNQTNSAKTSAFAHGQFTFTDEVECDARRFLKVCKAIADANNPDLFKQEGFVAAVKYLLSKKNAEADWLIRRAGQRPLIPANLGTMTAYKEALVKMYNYDLPNKSRRLFL